MPFSQPECCLARAVALSRRLDVDIGFDIGVGVGDGVGVPKMLKFYIKVFKILQVLNTLIDLKYI